MKNNIIIKSFFFLCALITGSISAWGQATPYYTLDTSLNSNAGTNSNYAQEGSKVVNGITWYATGNMQMQPWRIGGKASSTSTTATLDVSRTVYTATKMGKEIESIKLYIGDVNVNTFSSVKLTVSDKSDFSSVTDEITKNSPSANSTQTFTPTSGSYWAKDLYYKFTINATLKGKSNTYVQFTKVEFYDYSSGGSSTPTYAVTYVANGGTGTMTDANSPYEEGDEVTLLANTFTAPTGKGFNGWVVKDATNADVTVSNGKFTMPASNVTVTAQWQAYTITAQSNNNTYGTVSLEGNVITGAASEGYRYASPAYTVSSGSATVVQEGNEFTVTPTTNCTITINFEPVPTHTVTFSINSNTTSQDVAEGAAVPFPEKPANISGKTFVGWATSTISGTTSTPPAMVTSATMGESDVTYYAVFADASGSGETTVELTNKNIEDNRSGKGSYSDEYNINNWTGRYLLSSSGTTYYLQLGYNTSSTASAYNSHLTTPQCANNIKSITINTNNSTASGRTFFLCSASNLGTASSTNATYGYGSTTSANGSVTINVSGNTKQFHIYPDGTAYIASVSVSYSNVTYSNYCTTVEVAAVETPEITVTSPFKISTSVEITCDTDDVTIYYTLDGSDPTSASEVYVEPFTITETTTIKAIAINEDDDESSIASATATKVLADPTVTIDANGLYNRNLYLGTVAGKLTASVTYEKAAVEGATVSWSGNNDEVATIDENTGAVTLVAAGSVTFTATFVETPDYSEQTADYVLKVINADPSIATIYFGSADGSTKINGTSVYGDDSNGNTWAITTVMSETSFTQNASYSQVGSSKKPATSITFTTTLKEDVKITSLSAKFGGFSGTAGTVTLKVDNSSVGSGSLNAASDVTVSSSSSAVGKVLTVTVTGISNGVKCYYISYTVESVNAVPSESRFWSSFYNSSKSYKLPLGAQAFTMHNDNKLYLLGEDGSIIPAGTAVIIISDKASNALVECTTSIADSDNILKGSDTAYTIPVGKVAYVLGIAGSPAKIGFYKYSGDTIPAGKAYIVNE